MDGWMVGECGGNSLGHEPKASISRGPCQQRFLNSGSSLRDQIFFLLRTTLKDRPRGPPTANRQHPSTDNRHQLPTTNRHQPPATNRRQPPAATNRQQRPTANCQPLPADPRNLGSCMVELMTRQLMVGNFGQPRPPWTTVERQGIRITQPRGCRGAYRRDEGWMEGGREGSTDVHRAVLNGKKKVFRNQFSQKSPRALHVLNHGWWRLAVGGGWRLAVGGWWWLAAVGGCARVACTCVLSSTTPSPLFCAQLPCCPAAPIVCCP